MESNTINKNLFFFKCEKHGEGKDRVFFAGPTPWIDEITIPLYDDILASQLLFVTPSQQV